MSSIEQEVKQQFARVFTRQDWSLFKRMADYYLRSAVFLRTWDVKPPKDLKLLARNCQKRLFIGIGTELLLKAIYLKHGFSINTLAAGQAGAPLFPFTFQQTAAFTQVPDKTFMLNDLLQKLGNVPAVGRLGAIGRGLRIAKVFRNKEGHVVVAKHLLTRLSREAEAPLLHEAGREGSMESSRRA